MNSIQALSEKVGAGNRAEARRITEQLLAEGVMPQAIVDEALVPAMAAVGERFKCNQAFVPELLIAARAMKEAMTLLEPRLAKAVAQDLTSMRHDVERLTGDPVAGYQAMASMAYEIGMAAEPNAAFPDSSFTQ